MKIKVNNCKDPKNCMKCVGVCPAKIFVLKPTGTRRMSNYVKKWEIKALFRDLCNGCMKCIEVCPEGCIEITF
ncbi:MAG: 4Fe-4S binding protein [Candidatus Syntropharchaeia archaeon]